MLKLRLLFLKQLPYSSPRSPLTLLRPKRLNLPSPRSSQRPPQRFHLSQQRSRKGLCLAKSRLSYQRRAKRTRKLVKVLKLFSLNNLVQSLKRTKGFQRLTKPDRSSLQHSERICGLPLKIDNV